MDICLFKKPASFIRTIPFDYYINTQNAPGKDRTCDTRIRNPVLYPLSYGGIGP